MKRLLCIVNSMDTGGAETFLMKIYRQIDRTKYQMDFCTMSPNKGFYDDEIIGMGGKLYNVPLKTKNPIGFIKGIKQIVKDNKYEYVLRIGDNAITVFDLLVAKWGGARKLVMRSTNASSSSRVELILNKCLKFLSICIPNVKIAPSTEAAIHTFGKRQVENGKVHYLNNGIAVDKFEFAEEKRTRLREELDLKDKFVVGHVGRFSQQKNHKFLIDIFEKIASKNNNAHLVCIGIGEMQEEIWNIVKAKNLDDKVTFTGVRSDVSDLLSAFDVFLFPSFFEGMPNVIIEGQAAGLHCIISDSITKEANITGLVEYLPLDKPAAEWAESVLKYADGYERISYKDTYVKCGYDIESVAKDFAKLVFGE